MKRLNSRIDRLEQQAGTPGGLSMPDKIMLVECFGRVHAVFVPWRWQIHKQVPMAEIIRRQRGYLKKTSGVSARADGQSQWKSASETRQSLVAAGMLEAIGANGETTSVILTRLGLATATRLIGDRLASHADAEIGLAILKAKIYLHGSPVRESVLFNHSCFGDPGDWEHLEELMVPLLVAGVVRTNSDTCGRILYAVTGSDIPEALAVDIPAEEEIFDPVYMQAFNAERAFLTTAEPQDPMECYIPVGASDAWPKTEEPTDEKI
jgi:hypothetical protein